MTGKGEERDTARQPVGEGHGVSLCPPHACGLSVLPGVTSLPAPPMGAPPPCPSIPPRSVGSPKGLWGQAGQQQHCPGDTLTLSLSPTPTQPGSGGPTPLGLFAFPEAFP